MDQPPLAPRAERRPQPITQLGRTRVDDYAWMKDDNWQEVMRDPAALRPDIRDHLEAENAYTRAMLTSTEALQAEIFSEMKGRIKEDDASLPAPDGPFDYYSRYEPGAQHPLFARRPRSDAPVGGGPIGSPNEQVLLDVDSMAKAHAYFAVSEASHSWDHALYAWSEDSQGSEYYRIIVKRLSDARVLTEIESSTGDFVFSPDSRWIFWTWRDENGRPAKIFRRSVEGGEDALVYAEADPGFFLGVSVTASRQFILIAAGNQETSEASLIPASEPLAAPRLVAPRQVGVRYEIEHWTDRFVVRTNADEAIDFKLMWADGAHPDPQTWTPWIAHRPGVFVTGLHAYRDWLVIGERVDANDRLVMVRRDTLESHVVGVEEEAYALHLEPGYEYDTEVTRYVYTSPTTPRQWFDYAMDARSRTLRKTQEVPSGHDPSRYVTRRLRALAPDGAEVPVTVLMLKDTPLSGRAPLMLYGYGSYGHAVEPAFSIRQLSLVDRGWIWATAHVRGGSEKGWGWFLDGRKQNKPNTFSDFVACAESLHEQGYGCAGRTVAYGGSAGGLLVGAVTNLRPDLWAGVIAAVPFVDVLNTMSDVSLPLTPPEWPEWGNPLEDESAYDVIAAYSPYDNVAPRPYPAVLATGGLSDPRVTYWEPAKWAAKLREATTSGRPILLKINMEAGHGGASGRFDFLKEIALDYAFAVWAVEQAPL